jgi:hypothetical protein
MSGLPIPNCTDCLAARAGAPRNKQFIELAKVFPDCACQNCSFSTNSPGLVADSEDVARHICSPQHIDAATGEIQPNAFNDLFDKGLSVNRLQYADARRVHELGEQLVQNRIAADKSRNIERERKYLGYLAGNVGQARDLTLNGRRVICVYDTSLSENVAHADYATAFAFDDLERAEIRKRLRGLFTAELMLPP